MIKMILKLVYNRHLSKKTKICYNMFINNALDS